MTVATRLKRFLEESSEDVFVRSEFAKFWSSTQASRVLRSLIADGVLVRLGLRVYAKAKRSILSGAAIPVRPVEILAPIALKKLGVEVAPSQATQNYNNGSTTQLPAGIVLNTGQRRVSPRLGFGNRVVSYETLRRVRPR
ncbi:S-adenosylhomocysteine hydrolase [Cupriavidus sp. BIC8F]|uniref:S-adenosylhomocysteine hydrolase n=1 Tax=Cupriavidus sp. BIC8F TaxID=3079014 RepID=UPI00291631F8|nr:S-adenosylhomocysteine hydrolase [Cupriavidus sp. BIC8F]